MTQTIKPNDLVYIPYLSVSIFTARQGTGGKLSVFHSGGKLSVFHSGGKEITFLPNGKLGQHDATPLVYLATPENKTKLEEFYGITLEDIPVDEEVEIFKEMLDTVLSEVEKGNFDKESHFDELVRLFNARGAK